MDEQVAELLNEFETLSRQHAGPIPFSLRFGSGHPHLLVTTTLHGNEVGGIPSVVEAANDLAGDRLRFSGTITLVVGNMEAIKINKRYVTEDLNRSFKDYIPGDNYEQDRASEIASVIDEADYYIDLHQTINPTVGPFYIVENSERSVDFAQAIGAADKVIYLDHNVTSRESYPTSLAYATDRGKVGFVIELSKMGLNKRAKMAADRCIRKAIDLLAKGEHSIIETAHGEKDLRRMKIAYKADFSGPGDQLKKGFVNLAQIKKDEVVGERANGDKIKSPLDGFMLFPKYPKRDSQGNCTENIPEDLFLILTDA